MNSDQEPVAGPSTLSSSPDREEEETSDRNKKPIIKKILTVTEEQDQQQQQQQTDDNNESVYHLKWFQWNTGKIPIVMQSINGPCPLIATINVLLLREKIKLPEVLEQITANQLLAYIGERIIDSKKDDSEDEIALSNLEQNISDAMDILPKLKTGLDVNVRFTGITDFEYTPECIIFDLLRIPLYHGWLIDPTLNELNYAIGGRSYNQLVDFIIGTNEATLSILSSSAERAEALGRKYLAEEFLEGTASQLTPFGLQELRDKIQDNEIGILFRNNHFLTLFKRDNELYTLVTDHGYLTEENIVWESLDNIEGAGRYFDATFQSSETTNRQIVEFEAIDQRQKQMESDFQLALSLRDEDFVASSKDNETAQRRSLTDFELAKQLQAQEEEDFKKER